MPDDPLLAAATRALAEVLQDGRPIALHETATSRRAIDPLIEALGYRTPDQFQRAVCMQASGQIVDYLLTAGSGQRIVVATHGVNNPLTRREVRQRVDSCAQEGVRWMLLTSGRVWHIFDTSGSGDLEAKRIARIDLADAQRDGRLAEGLRPLALFAHDALADGDAALSAWAARVGRTRPPASVGAAPAPRSANHYLLTARGSGDLSGEDVLRLWLPTLTWRISWDTEHLDALQRGDQCCFFATNAGVVATAEIDGPPDEHILEADWAGPGRWIPGYYILRLRTGQWLPQPLPIPPAVRARLQSTADEAITPITERDFHLLAGTRANV